MSYYEVLQLGETAAPEEIRAAYLRLAQQYHPDRRVGGDPVEDDRERFKQIQEAYEVLHDPEQRKVYDHGRSIVPRPRTDRRTAVDTPARRRDVPHEWLQRRLPRKRKKPRYRRLLFFAAVVLLATMVVPQCSRLLESELSLPALLGPAMPATADASSNGESAKLTLSVADAGDEFEPEPTRQSQRAEKLDAVSMPESERGDDAPSSPTVELGQMVAEVPDLQTLEWLSGKNSWDWSEAITATSKAEGVDFNEVIQASNTEQVGLWTPEPVTTNSAEAFDLLPAEVPVFKSTSEFALDQVWPQGRPLSRSITNRAPLRPSGQLSSYGGSMRPGHEQFSPTQRQFPKSLPNRAFGAPSMGQLGESDKALSRERNYGFGRPHVGPHNFAPTGFNSGQPRLRTLHNTPLFSPPPVSQRLDDFSPTTGQ